MKISKSSYMKRGFNSSRRNMEFLRSSTVTLIRSESRSPVMKHDMLVQIEDTNKLLDTRSKELQGY